MSPLLKSYAGKSLYNGWMLRKRLSETERPILVKVLAGLVALTGIYVMTEGVVTGWFLPDDAPYRRDLDFVRGRDPSVKVYRWMAATLLTLIGSTGLYAAGFLARRRRSGAQATMLFIAALFASGAVYLYGGREYDESTMTARGSVSIAAGVLLTAMLGLGWYTLDPLALHWSEAS